MVVGERGREPGFRRAEAAAMVEGRRSGGGGASVGRGDSGERPDDVAFVELERVADPGSGKGVGFGLFDESEKAES